MGGAVDRRHRRADRAVVEQPQVAVAAALEQLVGLADVDLAAEEVGEDAAVVPGRVVLEVVGEALEQQLRHPARLHLLVDRAALVGLQVAGQQRRLAFDRVGAAGLVDVGALAHQPRRLLHLRLAAAGHDHDLDPGPRAGLQRPRLRHREAAVRVAEEHAAGPEQGPVEIGVDAGEWHSLGRYRSDRALEAERPHPAADRAARRRDRQRHRRLDVRGRAQRHPRAGGPRRPGAGRGGVRDARRRRGGGQGRPTRLGGGRGRGAGPRHRRPRRAIAWFLTDAWRPKGTTGWGGGAGLRGHLLGRGGAAGAGGGGATRSTTSPAAARRCSSSSPPAAAATC